MANNIERLNYYEREYLRSFDFVAEQNYHLEMRRRLNLALHLWGIVDGLDVVKGNIVPGAPDQFYITEGMAIDAYGREIILFAPYVLTADDLHQNRVGAGSYSLWIAYDRNRSTPPSAGYGLCDIKDQYTRWSESFKIVLKPESYANGTEPRVFAALQDDPEKAKWLVPLGKLQAGIVNGELTVTDVRPDQRTYIGLRAERLVTPADATKNFDVLKPNTALLPATSLGVQANLFAEQNAIVGADFDVQPGDIVPPPKPTKPAVFPNLTGNVKIANDLFLRGNFYGNVDGKWLSLAEQISALTPETLVGSRQITVTDPGNGTERITRSTTKLKKISKVEVAASIAAVIWNDLATRFEIFLAVGPTAQLSYQIISATGGKHPTVPNSCNIDIAWKVEPTALIGATPTFASAIVGLTFAYVVICYP